MRRIAALVGLIVALAAVPAAQAASTIGQVFTPTAQTTATIAQVGVASGVGYRVPNDGVITAWSFQADTDGATVRLKVARANDDGTYTIVGESEFQTARSNQLETYQTRIPVRAGDVIGTSSSAGKTVAYTGSTDDQVVLSPGDQGAGSNGAYSSVQGIRIDVSASIEADADADGFGDETQDLCTNDPGTQSACSADLELSAASHPATVHPGELVTFVISVSNRGPSLAVGTKLIAQLSDELAPAGIVTEGADCSGPGTVTCTVQDIPVDGFARIEITARARGTGVGSVAASVSAKTLDPNLRNNSAGASAPIGWLPGRCANVFLTSAKDDVKKGTAAGDSIDGGAGNDTLDGLGGADCLAGGAGNDRLLGDDGNDRLDGGDGDDSLNGGSGTDQIDGGAGNDRIVGGEGPDRISAGAGEDSVNAADGKRDRVDCGSGRDSVRADRGDVLTRCEKVVRVAKKRR